MVSQKVSAQKSIGLGYKFFYPKPKTALKVICDQSGYKVVTEQWVPQPIDKVYEFFDQKNLEIFTPGFLHFKIAQVSHPKDQEGTVVDYRLKLHSAPVRWQSRITGWVPYKRFSDLQARGSYTFWHHIHEFYESKRDTVIRDNVTYKLPECVLWDILAHAYIKKDLEKFFIFRRQ